MKLKLVRQVKNINQEQQKEDENKMDEIDIDYEKDMVQYSFNDERLRETKSVNDVKGEGGNNMGEANKELTEEERIEKEAFLRMRNMENFPSMSNKLGKQEEESKEDAQEFDLEKDELQRKKEAKKFKKEMKEILKELEAKKNSNDKSWEFEGNISVVMRDGLPYKYNLSISAMQLSLMYLSQQIIYDESVQRGKKLSKTKGELPLINKKHSEEILQAILEDDSNVVDGGTIYLNYAKENPIPLQFDPQSNKLSGKFPLSVNDGAHRLECCVMWFNKLRKEGFSVKNPEDFNFTVAIINADHDQSEHVFVELNSFGLPVSKTRISYHSVYNLNNIIAKRIMNGSFLRGRIEVVSNSIKKTGNCVMTFNTLLKGCAILAPETPSQIEETVNFSCSFWNELVEIFPKIFGNVTPEIRQEEKSKIFIGEVMFINSLFVVAKELQNKEDWKDRLKKLFDNNFLSRQNPIWSFCLRDGSKLVNSSKVQKDISNLMVNKVMGVE